jgi:hypothetical protein
MVLCWLLTSIYEVKKPWSYNSAVHTFHMYWCLSKWVDYFALYKPENVLTKGDVRMALVRFSVV